LRKNLIALALVALLPPTLGVRPFAGEALGGVVGSPHDFSRTGSNYNALLSWPIAPGGACSACHVPHRAPDNVGWPRDLSFYSRTHSGSTTGGGRLDIRDGAVGKADYLRNDTVPCYDCHDRHLDGLIETTSIPLLADYVSGHKPQNILSGFRKSSLGSMTEYSPGVQAGKVVPGFFETSPPGSAANFGAADLVLPGQLGQTGGHHFQVDPRGTSGTGADPGDKLPCSDCHDPHAWDSQGDWQAFFRKVWPTGTVLSNLGTLSGGKAIASSYMANDSTPTNKRASDLTGANGRYLCIVCHGTFDSSAYPNRVRYSDINSEYDNSSQIVGLPDTVGEHFNDSKVACVSCHSHNSISASCTMCHGFPPSTTAISPYPSNFTPVPNPADNDAHARHYGARSGEVRNALRNQGYLYAFDCKECHAGSSMGYDSALGDHQNDNVSVIIFEKWTPIRNITLPNGKGLASSRNYFNRSRAYPPIQSGTKTGQLDNSTNTATGWGESAARLGGNRCTNVYCHSAGIAFYTGDVDNVTIYRPVNWNSGKKLCNDCHGYGTVSADNAAYGGRVNLGMPNYPNAGVGSRMANSHLTHVMVNGYECSVCHYNTVTGTGAARAVRTDVFPTLHVNTVRNVVFNGTSASGSYDNTTKSCDVTCHGTDTPRWGGQLTGGCFACHSGTEAPEKPQLLPAVPNPVSLQEYTWSGHGRTGTTYTGTGNRPAAFDNYTAGPAADCFICHSGSSSHTTKNPLDPYRLGAGSDTAGQIGSVKGAFASNTDALCLACHGSDAERAGHPEAATGPSAINALTHANAVTGEKYASWPVSPWKCVDCHDPHGDGLSTAERLAMVRSAINAPTGSTDASAGSDAYGTPRRATPLKAVTFTSQAGMVAGSYAFPAPNRGQGICELCHTQTSLFNQAGAGNVGSHLGRTGRCTTCHVHKAGFKGLGGPDVGQFFDRALVPGGAAENFNDNSSHPLIGLTDNTTGSYLFGLTENCLGCHYTSGPARTSNECLKCHFEEGNSPVTNHMDGIVTLARITSNTSAPIDNYPVNSLADYDGWCLQCHGGTSFTLGGRSPSASRGTLLSPADFAAGRHRAQLGASATGCIYCHAVHGEGNAQLVRHNAANRAGAGFAPRKFGVFPLDNLDNVAPAYGRSGAQSVRYFARIDNQANASTHSVFADAADENNFCNTACHNPTYPKDHVLLRDETTGSYVLTPSMRKIHLIDNVRYTLDNLSLAGYAHIHVNNEIIPTDNMVDQYAAAAAVSGPSRYHYPNLPGNDPASFTSVINADYLNRFSKLPLHPDFTDGSRDFTNGYLNKGPVRYRFTCSTCHNPHGTPEPNTNRGSEGWPDLRARRTNPNTLCSACH
jgi:predicted CxxxxCH...CXXCH cytochrome family protein